MYYNVLHAFVGVVGETAKKKNKQKVNGSFSA